jgi:hypothetical protein
VRYLTLIYTTEGPRPSDADMQKMMTEYGAVTQEMRDKGAYLAGEALQPVATATTVRVRNGERLVTDGPFAETREQLGGFYMLECKDLDEALAWAAKLPGARFGSVEVRPILVMG